MVSAIEKQFLQSQVIERIQQVQQLHPDMQQQYFKHQLAQERHRIARKVNEFDKMNHVTVGEEGKKQQRDPPREQESAERTVDEKAGSEQEQHEHIDIKV